MDVARCSIAPFSFPLHLPLCTFDLFFSQVRKEKWPTTLLRVQQVKSIRIECAWTWRMASCAHLFLQKFRILFCLVNTPQEFVFCGQQNFTTFAFFIKIGWFIKPSFNAFVKTYKITPIHQRKGLKVNTVRPSLFTPEKNGNPSRQGNSLRKMQFLHWNKSEPT